MKLGKTWFGVPPVLAAVLLTSGVAHSDLLTRLTLFNRYPVPANGVLVFSHEPDMTVRIIAEDGSEVAGGFIAEGYWRPEEPFALGVYTADVIFEPNPSRAVDKTFEVVEAQEPRLDFIQVEVESTVLARGVLKEACCEEGAATVFGMACTQDCKPLCVPLEYAAEQWVSVNHAVNYDDPMSDQVIVRIPTETPEGFFSQGGWLIEGTPEEFCGAAEVYSWLDESTTLLTECITNPKPELAPIRESPSSFGTIFECSLPPPDYRTEWCAAQAYGCEVAVLTLPEGDRAATHQACSGYYDICSRPDPLSEEGSLTSEGDNAASGENIPAASPDDTAPGGCTCSVGRDSQGASTRWLAPWVLLGVAGARRRRRVAE